MGDLWALFFARVDGANAVLDGVLAKETKVVWRVEGEGAITFTITAPDGSRTVPVWLEQHGGSNWNRPGDEWGSGIDFSQLGCWQIHVERTRATDDLWVLVRS